MKEDLEQLAAEIHAEFPGATTEIESHPPSLMLNVRWNSKLFILAYVGNRWGVDMMRDGGKKRGRVKIRPLGDKNSKGGLTRVKSRFAS